MERYKRILDEKDKEEIDTEINRVENKIGNYQITSIIETTDSINVTIEVSNNGS